MFNRMIVRQGALERPSGVGDGINANFSIKNYVGEADAAISLAELDGGLLFQGVTLTSDVTYTLPTAAVITAAWEDMDIGDCATFAVTNSQVGAFDVVIAVGTGITKIGANNTLSVPPQSTRLFCLVKTAAATLDLY